MISKQKNRYLLIETSEQLDTRDRVSSSSLLDALNAEMGHTGFLRANPRIVCTMDDYSFIIRVNRGCEHDFILATAFVKRIAGREIGLYTISTSGTIRKLLGIAGRSYPSRTERTPQGLQSKSLI